jgi:two-component system, HptB-dependent secretion and biofilm response regulator
MTTKTLSKENNTFTKTLTLLLVEDEQMSREMLHLHLDEFFEHVFVARDGNEGFALYCEFKPDIILTDQVMPGLSGLELMSKIRAMGAINPVILMTSSINNQILQEAINLGIVRFIPKPFVFDLILQTLDSVAETIVNGRQLEQHRQREVELLRYRDTYNAMQQESARRKERHVVRHDLQSRILEGARGVRWGINVAYSPRDIMCGDGYSIRNLFDGRQLIFIVDAMGSGMSASLTAMLSTSFCNYQVENLHKWETFTLKIFLTRFQEYLTGMLLEEEVLSCGFFLIDLANEEIETALFALPPLLFRNLDGSVLRIRGGNPPIGIYPSEIKISSYSLTEIADILIMTDGVSDAPLTRNGSYREELEDDFREAPTLAAFQRRFKMKTDQEELDDLTLLHVRRLDFDFGWKWKRQPDISLRGMSRVIREFLNDLALETDLLSVEHDELEFTLTEAMTNAFEHGCLGIDRDEKTRLQLIGEYEDLLEQKTAAADAAITLSATLWRKAGKPLLILEICDNGPGLLNEVPGTTADAISVNGRGLQMIRRFSDSLFVGSPGGDLFILKTLEGGLQ